MGCSQDLRAVPAGRDNGGTQAVTTQTGKEPDGRRVGGHPIAFQQVEKYLVLAVAEPVDGALSGRVFGRPSGSLDAARFEEAGHAVKTRLAVHEVVVLGINFEGAETVVAVFGVCPQKF